MHQVQHRARLHAPGCTRRGACAKRPAIATIRPANALAATLQAMRARGAADVSLTECTAVPASHIGCVPEFLIFVRGELAKQVRDL